MKKLSRLTAVLLALLMLASVALADETMTIDQLNNSNYGNMLTDVQTYGLKGEAYDYYVRQLEGMTVEQRYAKLVDWYGSFLGEVGFYKGFVNHYKTNYPDGDLICICEQPMPYGDMGHTEGCKWHPGATLLVKFGEEAVAAWLADETVTVTEEMMVRAMKASSLQSIMIEGDVLVSVYTGQPIAYYDAETNMVMDISTGLCFSMDKLTGGSEAAAETQE